MSTEAEPAKIYGAMARILAAFPGVTKSEKNKGMGYNYRGIDLALNAVHGLLGEHGVFLLPRYDSAVIEPVGTTAKGASQVRALVKGRLQFVATDGSFVECDLVGEGIDTGDKALMKAQANALKYAIFYTFAVATDERKDSEAFDEPEAVEETKPSKKRGRKAKGPATLAELFDACEDKEQYQALVDEAQAQYKDGDDGTEQYKLDYQAATRASSRLKKQ